VYIYVENEKGCLLLFILYIRVVYYKAFLFMDFKGTAKS
jgi:hypothetical protein